MSFVITCIPPVPLTRSGASPQTTRVRCPPATISAGVLDPDLRARLVARSPA